MTDPHPSSGPHRRGLALAVAGCLASAAVLVLASGQGWLQVTLPARSPLPAVGQTLTGQEVVDLLTPIGILVGAAGLALIATRRIGRLLVASVVAGAGLLMLATVGFFLYDGGSLQAEQWAQARATAGESVRAGRSVVAGPAVFALSGSVLAVAVGAFALLRSRCWPAMGAKYERSTGQASDGRPLSAPATEERATDGQTGTRAGLSEAGMWAAIERGEDPTVTPSGSRTDDSP